jgi:endonuclease III
LRVWYGPFEVLEPRDPFALIVWENCAYLVDDARRARTYRALEELAGINPAALLAAGPAKIEAAIAGGGMRPGHRAAKVIRCAEVAVEFADGDLRATLDAISDTQRRTLLRRFPGIADPGAAKVLLFSGYSSEPALESNGLRVLERLGAIEGRPTYAATYRAGVAALRSCDAFEAFTLLREHGRSLCKASRPRCPECPLRAACAFVR